MAEDSVQEAPADNEIKSLTDWDNEPTLRELKQDISDADIDNQTHQQDVNRWLDHMSMTGSAAIPKVEGRSSVAPKMIRKNAEWRYASLSNPFLNTPDVYNVAPKSAGDVTRAQQNALVLNHQFNNYIDKVSFIDDYVRDAVDTGTVIVEVGWYSEEEEIEEMVPVYDYQQSQDPRLAQYYNSLIQKKQQSQDAYHASMNPGLDKAVTLFEQTGTLLQPMLVGEKLETKVIETANHPYVEVRDSANILIDPTCNGNLKKAQFVGVRDKTTLSELKKDGRYKNLKQILVDSASPLSDPDYKDSPDVGTFEFKDEPRKQLVRYTYWGEWDIYDTGITVPIVASWVNNVMIRLEENPFPFKRPPFAIAKYMPVRKSVFGEPDAELLIDNQKIVGAITRGSIDLMGKSANGQTGTKQNFLDAANKRKFKRGDDYEFQGSQGMRPEDSIYQHKYPEIPNSVFNMLNWQNTEAESISGVKAFANGLNSQALGDSVGGGRDAMDAASKRESGILMRLGQGIIDIGHMFIAMNAEFLSEEEVVRITDEEFVTVRRDDLGGRFDLTLSISTAEEDNARAAELSFMLQTKGPEMDFGLYKIILSAIARLRKMPDIAKRIEEFEPEPDPLVVKEQELKILLLERQIAKEDALANKHNAEAAAAGHRAYKDSTQGDLNTSKVGTEEAKSRDLSSSADNKDLDYLEKFDGTQHKQAIEMESVKSELNNKNKE